MRRGPPQAPARLRVAAPIRAGAREACVPRQPSSAVQAGPPYRASRESAEPGRGEAELSAPLEATGGASGIRALSGRIGSETEPPNLATETNTGRGAFRARNPQSPVRIRVSSTAKTPRNRGDFSGCAGVRAGSLRSRRLDGGACSRSRTRLWNKIPDLQGKYREFARNQLPGDARFSSPSPFRGPTRLVSLNSETGKFLPTSRESRDANRLNLRRLRVYPLGTTEDGEEKTRAISTRTNTENGQAAMDPTADRRLRNLEFRKEIAIPRLENRVPDPVIVGPA